MLKSTKIIIVMILLNSFSNCFAISMEQSRAIDEEWRKEHPPTWWQNLLEILLGIVMSGPGIEIVPAPRTVVIPVRAPQQPVRAPQQPVRAPQQPVRAPQQPVRAPQPQAQHVKPPPVPSPAYRTELLRLRELNELETNFNPYSFHSPDVDNTFRLKWPSLKHILERHVPRYLDPKQKSNLQTLFPQDTDYTDVIACIQTLIETQSGMPYYVQPDGTKISNAYIGKSDPNHIGLPYILNSKIRLRVQESIDKNPYNGLPYYDIVQVYPK